MVGYCENSSTLLEGKNIVVSSAKSIDVENFRAFGRLFVIQRRDPYAEPWGTPRDINMFDDVLNYIGQIESYYTIPRLSHEHHNGLVYLQKIIRQLSPISTHLYELRYHIKHQQKFLDWF